MIKLLAITLFLLVSACQTSDRKTSKDSLDKVTLHKASFSHMSGWDIDDHHEALEAFNKSCKRTLSEHKKTKLPGIENIAGKHSDWKKICKLATDVSPLDAREFFELHFHPYKVSSSKGHEGVFTGYHEPNLKGSFTKTAKYKYPIYKTPHNKRDQSLSREEISNGKLNGKGLELLYTDDEVELFFMQIQGSGKIHLENGKVVNIGYAAHNNHNYVAISNYMIKHYNVKLGEISASFIKKWLNKDPARGRKVMNINKSYVFFQINKGEGPIGAHNVALTPERSLAIDNRYWPFGLPIWLQTKDGYDSSFNKLLIAQDRGGAIKGIIRGDIFFGSDNNASKKASIQKQLGHYYVLLPKEVSPCCMAN